MKVDVLKPGDAAARVYQFGVRINEECQESLGAQFALAHTTYNEIVAEIRRITLEAIAWLQMKAGNEAARLRNSIVKLDERWMLAKAADDREGLQLIAQERRGLWRNWYQLMHEARRKHSVELQLNYLGNIGERKECKIYQIRCEAVGRGLGWATGNAVLKAAIQAHKKQWPKFKVPNFRKNADVPRRTLELQFTKKGGIGVSESLFRMEEDTTAIATA